MPQTKRLAPPKKPKKLKKKLKKPKTAVKASQQPKNDLYEVRLAISGESYAESAETIVGALAGIKPTMFKTRGIFTVSQGGRCSEIVMKPFEVKRLITNPMTQTIFAKRMALLLK